MTRHFFSKSIYRISTVNFFLILNSGTCTNHHLDCNHIANSLSLEPCLVQSSKADQQMIKGLRKVQAPNLSGHSDSSQSVEAAIASSSLMHSLVVAPSNPPNIK